VRARKVAFVIVRSSRSGQTGECVRV